MTGDGTTVVWGIGTTRTFRAHWICAEAGLDWETRPVRARVPETKTPEFMTLSPSGKVPVLVDGGLVVHETGAIVLHVAGCAADSGLLPADDAGRAAVWRWCFFAASELDGTSLYVMRRHSDLAPLYGEAPDVVAAAEAYFRDRLADVERELADGRPWLLAGGFTAADVMVGACLLWARNRGLDLPDTTATYFERLRGRPGFGAAWHVNYGEDEAP